MFEEAKSEALGALGVFEKLGATSDVERTREFLMRIDSSVQGDGLGSDYGSDDDGGLLAAMLILSCSNRVAESE